MPDFTARPDGVTVSFDSQEADVLRRLLSEMEDLLLSAGIEDAVMERLFPDAYPEEEPEAREDYRRYAVSELERMRTQAVQDAIELAGSHGPLDLVLDEGNASMWLSLFTDIRLAIGIRLDVDEEKMEAPIDPRDPEAAALSVMHWVGWIQQEVIERLP